jgi:hypothetical protein
MTIVLIAATGAALIIYPYMANKIDPARLYHLSLMIELINKDIATIIDDKYPNHSNQLISTTTPLLQKSKKTGL